MKLKQKIISALAITGSIILNTAQDAQAQFGWNTAETELPVATYVAMEGKELSDYCLRGVEASSFRLTLWDRISPEPENNSTSDDIIKLNTQFDEATPEKTEVLANVETLTLTGKGYKPVTVHQFEKDLIMENFDVNPETGKAKEFCKKYQLLEGYKMGVALIPRNENGSCPESRSKYNKIIPVDVDTYLQSEGKTRDDYNIQPIKVASHDIYDFRKDPIVGKSEVILEVDRDVNGKLQRNTFNTKKQEILLEGYVSGVALIPKRNE